MPKVQGASGGYLFKPDNRLGELVGWPSSATRSPTGECRRHEQDAWYRRLREHLEADPEWEDGIILGGFSEGVRL